MSCKKEAVCAALTDLESLYWDGWRGWEMYTQVAFFATQALVDLGITKPEIIQFGHDP